MRIVAGVDDAGRGPVLGPMVIAGVAIPEGSDGKLQAMGVKDSKLLSPHRRAQLYDEIVKFGNVHYEVVPPSLIDMYVKRRRKFLGLNLLEAEMMAKVIEKLKPDLAIVDASDIEEQRFSEMIAERLPMKIKILAEHKADLKYPVVSAASIVAKVVRDRIIEDLKRDYGDFGSGYAADPKTIAFLKEYYVRNRAFPPMTRMSWKTVARMEKELAT
ncbi:MAG: ribonuclease HII [Candidatus Bathyarchaeia archaeon]